MGLWSPVEKSLDRAVPWTVGSTMGAFKMRDALAVGTREHLAALVRAAAPPERTEPDPSTDERLNAASPAGLVPA